LFGAAIAGKAGTRQASSKIARTGKPATLSPRPPVAALNRSSRSDCIPGFLSPNPCERDDRLGAESSPRFDRRADGRNLKEKQKLTKPPAKHDNPIRGQREFS
jgi:hypothetical protein